MILNLSITKYESPHIDLLLDFWKSSHALSFVRQNSWEIEDWITDNLYYDDNGDIWSKGHWPQYLCERGCYNKHTFVAWQIVGYQLKGMLDSGEIAIEVTDGTSKYIPTWSINKINTKTKDIKTKIKDAKHEWSRKKQTWASKCKIRGQNINEGYIRICCVCNTKPIKILKKIVTDIIKSA